ncbi:hypothetical protein HY995_02395 [Candidatus Micrarchaeota archaeon]|nr:hypothetical protein [Candidatus Micrarchaeota archaeon]
MGKIRLATALVMALALFAGFSAALQDVPVVIYNNEACGHCQPYISGLTRGLESAGLRNIEIRRFINNESARAELYRLQSSRSVPLSMQGHMVTFIGGKYLFEGHVPVPLVVDFLRNKAGDYPDGIVVTQDSMDESSARSYLFSDGSGVYEFPIGVPIGSSTAGRAGGGSLAGYAIPALIVAIPLLLLLFFVRSD